MIELPDDGVRRKVIRLPSDVWDPGQEKHVEEYAFHHYYEIFRDGKREESPLYTEEIVAQEVEFVDRDGTLGGMCIYWSIYDWDAPQYQPTEVLEFIEKYGEDSPYLSYKFYGSEDMEAFSEQRAEMLKTLSLPRRFVGKIRGPRGAQVVQSWHVGGTWTPVRAEILSEQVAEFRGQPGRHMHPVGDRVNRRLIAAGVRPDRAPHAAGDRRMDVADGIPLAGQTQSQDGHVEAFVRLLPIAGQVKKTLPVNSQLLPPGGQAVFDQVKRKRVMTGRDGRVGGEHAAGPDPGQRLVEGQSLTNEFAQALNQDQGGVALVQVPDARGNAYGA